MSRTRRLIAGTAASAMLVTVLSGCTGTIKASDIGAVSQPAAQQALVTVDDMPDGWTPSPADADDATKSVYDPAACSVLGDRPAATSRMSTVSYERGGVMAAALVETIYRPQSRTPAQELAQVRTVVSQCGSYRYRKGENKGYVVSVTPLEVKKQATGTFAIRSAISGAMSAVGDDIVWVAAGDVVVRFDSITAGDGMTQKDLEKLVKTSLSRLKK